MFSIIKVEIIKFFLELLEYMIRIEHEINISIALLYLQFNLMKFKISR